MTTVPLIRPLVGLGAVLLLCTVPAAAYPLRPDSLCGGSRTCGAVIDSWNAASRAALVDSSFNSGSQPLSAVRWYTTEGQCTGSALCDDQLQSGDGACPVLDTATHHFCGVTDELSNVLLSHALGSDEIAYRNLRNFTELLRDPDRNNLQCWKYYVHGADLYDDVADLCVAVPGDSAADASLRILHAYALACAKHESGLWVSGGVDYCADYLAQAAAIWGSGTPLHGEIRLLTNGEYFLASSFNVQPGSPTGTDSFRPDYYELQALVDYAEYVQNAAFSQGVGDMLADYGVSMGDNHIHCGKTGHFDASTTTYTCDQLCSPAYMDNIDTWRAVPALAGLRLVHPETVSAALSQEIFDYWWSHYSGGHPTLYGPTAEKPIEIYCQSTDGGVRQTEESYKTLGMWIPLAASYDATYTREAIDFLVDVKYDWQHDHFFGATYYGGYFSQFAQRAIGAATGMIDPAFWRGSLFSDGFETGDTSRWTLVVP